MADEKKKEEKTSKKGGCLKIGCGGFLAFILLGVVAGFFVNKWEEEDIEKCNKGVVESCENLKDSENDLSDLITNPQYKEVFLEKKKAKEEELRIKAEKKAKEDFTTLQNEVNGLKSDMSEIKSLLLTLVQKTS